MSTISYGVFPSVKSSRLASKWSKVLLPTACPIQTLEDSSPPNYDRDLISCRYLELGLPRGISLEGI